MYTKNEILLESSFYGDLTKIEVATDLMCESYIEDYNFSESVTDKKEKLKNAINSIITYVKTTYERLMKFISDKIEMIKRSSRLKRVEKIIGSETSEILKTYGPDTKVIMPDIKKISDNLTKITEGFFVLTNNAFGFIEKYEKAKNPKHGIDKKKTDKYNDYIDVSIEKLSKEYDKCIDMLNEKREVKISQALKEVRIFPDVMKRMENIEKMLKDSNVKINRSLDSFKRHILVKSENEFTGDEVESISSVKRILNKILNRTTYFVHKHVIGIEKILNFMTAFFTVGSISTTFKAGRSKRIKDLKPIAGNLVGVSTTSIASKAVRKFGESEPIYRPE